MIYHYAQEALLYPNTYLPSRNTTCNAIVSFCPFCTQYHHLRKAGMFKAQLDVWELLR